MGNLDLIFSFNINGHLEFYSKFIRFVGHAL